MDKLNEESLNGNDIKEDFEENEEADLSEEEDEFEDENCLYHVEDGEESEDDESDEEEDFESEESIEELDFAGEKNVVVKKKNIEKKEAPVELNASFSLEDDVVKRAKRLAASTQEKDLPEDSLARAMKPDWLTQRMEMPAYDITPFKVLGYKYNFEEMMNHLKPSEEFPTHLIMKTFEDDADRWPRCIEHLADPLAGWKFQDCLFQRTVPREKFLTQPEANDLSDKELAAYTEAVDYWKTLWFVQCFRHFSQECRVSEIVGKRVDQTFWRAPPLALPIRANVLTFDWHKFIPILEKHNKGKRFDVITTDPPWTLATEKSTRGVALNYDQITDAALLKSIPFGELLNDNGVVFLWIINAKVLWAMEFLEKQGFKVVESLCWMKMSNNRLMARGHGYYLQHAKEDCLVAVKGTCNEFHWDKLMLNFLAEKRCQSQKPCQFYDMVEAFAPKPDSKFCEVFGRRNNLRNGWVTIGNQL